MSALARARDANKAFFPSPTFFSLSTVCLSTVGRTIIIYVSRGRAKPSGGIVEWCFCCCCTFSFFGIVRGRGEGTLAARCDLGGRSICISNVWAWMRWDHRGSGSWDEKRDHLFFKVAMNERSSRLEEVGLYDFIR